MTFSTLKAARGTLAHGGPLPAAAAVHPWILRNGQGNGQRTASARTDATDDEGAQIRTDQATPLKLVDHFAEQCIK